MTQRCVHTSTPPSTRLWVLRSMWRCFDLRVRTSGDGTNSQYGARWVKQLSLPSGPSANASPRSPPSAASSDLV